MIRAPETLACSDPGSGQQGKDASAEGWSRATYPELSRGLLGAHHCAQTQEQVWGRQGDQPDMGSMAGCTVPNSHAGSPLGCKCVWRWAFKEVTEVMKPY